MDISNRMKTISIIGINGIPASYGGFETLAENLVKELQLNYKFIVYCSNIYPKNKRVKTVHGAQLIYFPLKANGAQAILYDLITTIHAWFAADILLILGPAAGLILFFNTIFRKKIIVNHGGLDEWKREKYSRLQRRLIYLNHFIAAKVADKNIADNIILQKSISDTFRATADVIKYGGDHIHRVKHKKNFHTKFPFLLNCYDLSISRAQVDNKLHLILDVYTRIPMRNLVIISNWEISSYGRELKRQYKEKYPNIYIIDAIYDKDVLDIIRSNTSLYIHSHSRCGTSPSLVEAMNYGIPIICYDVMANRETTENNSKYFSSHLELEAILLKIDSEYIEQNKHLMYSIAKRKYRWEIIAKKYAKLFDETS